MRIFKRFPQFRKLFVKIFINFIILLFPIIIIGVLTDRISEAAVQKESAQSNISVLNSLSGNFDQLFYEVKEISLLTYMNTELKYVINSNGKLEQNEYYIYYDILKLIRNLINTNDMYDSIFLYLKNENKLITNEGEYDFDYFFTTYNEYKDYDLDFWKNVFSLPDYYTILKNTSVSERNDKNITTRDVIPIVINYNEYSNSNVALVFNLDVNYMTQKLQDLKGASGGMLAIADSEGKTVAFTSPGYFEQANIPKDLFQKFSDAGKVNGQYFYDGNLFHYSYVKSSFNKYIYLSLVPESVIKEKTRFISNMTILICISLLIIGVFLSYFFSMQIYNPIAGILHLVQFDKNNIKLKELNFINNYILRLSNNFNKLTNAFSYMMPYGQERFFEKVLSGKYNLSDEEIEKSCRVLNIKFAYELFAVVVINMHFSIEAGGAANERYRNITIEGIKHTILEELDALNEKNVLLLDLSVNQFIIINNLSSRKDYNSLRNKFESVMEKLKSDISFVKFSVGIGGAYEQVQNMSRTYKEALEAASIAVFSADDILDYSYIDKNMTYYYPIEIENKLMNYMYSNNTENIGKMINTIFMNEMNKKISYGTKKMLISEVYNTLMRIIQAKAVNLQELDLEIKDIGKDDEIYSITYIIDYFTELFISVSGHIAKNIVQNDVVEYIKSYIDNNYKSDIYLEKISYELNMSNSYLSRFFKEQTGVSFIKYLSKKRIDMAKQMLLDNKMTIKEIAESVGFNNDHTFNRMFKNLEGITPGVFKEMHKHRG